MELRQYNKPYHTDHSIVYSCQYHVIFCSKYRRKVLTDAVAARMKELVLAKQADYGYTVIEMDVLPDHRNVRAETAGFSRAEEARTPTLLIS